MRQLNISFSMYLIVIGFSVGVRFAMYDSLMEALVTDGGMCLCSY